jgi:hypothetical protein
LEVEQQRRDHEIEKSRAVVAAVQLAQANMAAVHRAELEAAQCRLEGERDLAIEDQVKLEVSNAWGYYCSQVIIDQYLTKFDGQKIIDYLNPRPQIKLEVSNAWGNVRRTSLSNGEGRGAARQRAEIGRINQELKQELGGVMLARTDSHNRHVFELASVRVEMDEMEDEKEDALVRTEARSAVGPFAVTEIDCGNAQPHRTATRTVTPTSNRRYSDLDQLLTKTVTPSGRSFEEHLSVRAWQDLFSWRDAFRSGNNMHVIKGRIEAIPTFLMSTHECCQEHGWETVFDQWVAERGLECTQDGFRGLTREAEAWRASQQLGGERGGFRYHPRK